MSLALGETPLTLETLHQVAHLGVPVELTPVANAAMKTSRDVIDKILAAGERAPNIYGVNTGFGALAEVRISSQQIRDLQTNLVRSHAVGVGTPLSVPETRAMMLLRAAVLTHGLSGARPLVCQRLVDLLNHNIHPVIPCRGSVGASGDLAPLAHLALTLIGEGATHEEPDALRALAKAGLEPLKLEAKEGLTLLNGTQHMTAVGGLALYDALKLIRVADIAGALSLEALLGSPAPFHQDVAAARPHPGQIEVAQRMRMLTRNSEIVRSHQGCGKVQDPYSLRCIPQVHGASLDALSHCRDVLEREMNSVTDNPLVFQPERVVSGGNFHGQPVAMALDYAAIATSELANISERRIEQLVNPHYSSGLPAFLAREGGLHSGFMMAQVTAAALVSENKVLCHPASVDSIPSSAGREDHVSMGATSALKFRQVLEHVETVIAIELLCAAQGLDFRKPLHPNPTLRRAYEIIREVVPPLEQDRQLHLDIATVKELIDNDAFAHVFSGETP